MRQKNQPANLGIACYFQRPGATDDEVGMVENYAEAQLLIILDPQRPGDRRCLARILAQIAWRLVKEQAAQDVVSSQESRQNSQQ
jgi:hypothetical protein